jgi:hypothetical protein
VILHVFCINRLPLYESSCVGHFRIEEMLGVGEAVSSDSAAPRKPIKRVRFSADTKDNETKSSTSVEITHADVIEVLIHNFPSS